MVPSYSFFFVCVYVHGFKQEYFNYCCSGLACEVKIMNGVRISSLLACDNALLGRWVAPNISNNQCAFIFRPDGVPDASKYW